MECKYKFRFGREKPQMTACTEEGSTCKSFNDIGRKLNIAGTDVYGTCLELD